MSSLQPLYDVKERLEHAAIAGTGLLGEDFRLQRAAENMKSLTAASPVFGKISAGLEKLLAAPAEERPGLLLDVLSLVDAVAYTQGSSGLSGELEDLPTGGGAYQQISCGQLQPLLSALTSAGGGRMDIIRNNWEAHPEYFTDFRVLPALIGGLGDSYGEISELNAKILKSLGGVAVPLLKKDFAPGGKREMARRVEVIAAIEGADATSWLRDILPEARKDVRTAVLLALGADQANAGMLLELAKLERGRNREAVLESLAKQDGGEVQKFWAAEVKSRSDSVKFLRDTDTDWAGGLVAAGLRERVEKMLSGGGAVPAKEQDDFAVWCNAIGKKSSPAMLEFWQWACGQMEAIDDFKNEKDQPVFAGLRITDCLLRVLCVSGPGPVCSFCLTLWLKHPNMTRFMIHAFLAALMVRPAAEVYEKFSRYILVGETSTPAQKTFNDVLLRALTWVVWREDLKCYWIQENNTPFYERVGVHEAERRPGSPTAEPLDPRWIALLARTSRRELAGRYAPFGSFSGGETVGRFDVTLMNLVDPKNPEHRAQAIPYLRRRMLRIPAETGRGMDTGGVYTYCRWLLRLGGSPKGVLGKAMAQRPGRHYAYYFWQLLAEASKTLPAEEIAQIMEETEPNICFRKQELVLVGRAFPITIAALRAGKPFPEWDEWWKMR